MNKLEREELLKFLVADGATKDQAFAHIRSMPPKSQKDLLLVYRSRSSAEDQQSLSLPLPVPTSSKPPKKVLSDSIRLPVSSSIEVASDVLDSDKKLISLMMPKSEISKLKALSKSSGDAVSSIIRAAVRQYIKEHT